MPADLRKIAGVELVKVGRWEISTGSWLVTPALLVAAKAAFDSGSIPRPVLKIGHTDPRYDGNPAVGYVENLQLTDGGRTLVGDYVGVPAAVADILASAFPKRSIEGVNNLVMADGTKHKFALTAVALLGATNAGIGTLADIQSLYGVAASAGTSVTLVASQRVSPSTHQRVLIRAAASRRHHRRAQAALDIIEGNNP